MTAPAFERQDDNSPTVITLPDNWAPVLLGARDRPREYSLGHSYIETHNCRG
jgi:hypothetical protein